MSEEKKVEQVEKLEKAARAAGGLFDGLVNWWDNNLRSGHRILAVAAAGGTVIALVFLGYGSWHYYVIGNVCELQELELPAAKP